MPEVRLKKLALISLFILWIFFTLSTFFVVQKPFSVANAVAVSRVLLDMLTAGWLGLVGLGLGSWLLERLLRGSLSPGERVVFGTGLGLGLLGLLGLGLGLVGLFQPLVAYLIMVVLSLGMAPHLWRLFHMILSFIQHRRWPPANLPNRLAALYLALVGILALVLALLPPTDWDGLFYHLTGPKLYLQAGGLIGDMDIPHFSFPSLMEMLFAWAMLLRGDIAAKLLHFGFGLLLAGLVYLAARRFFGSKSAWPALLILASMPMLGTLAGWAYNDLALAFYQLASIYAIINYQLPITNYQLPIIKERAWLILSAIFAGLAMGLKYTSFVTPLVAGFIILWTAFRLLRPTHRVLRFTFYILLLSNLILFALVALLIASPWYLKNWTFTGNPVYPFLYHLFGGQFWDSFRADWYAAAGSGVGWQPLTLLGLPWLLTLGVRDANYWDGRTGPLLLLFLPLIIWVGFTSRAGDNRPKALTPLLIYSLAHFGFWALGIVWSRSLWQSRLLLPGLVGLAPVAGWVWTLLPRFDLPHFSISRFVNIAVGLALALTVVDTGLLTLRIGPLPYLAGFESRDDYLTRRLGAYYAAMQKLNEVLPAEARVVFLWEPRSYYCQRDCRPDSILDEFPHLTYQYSSAEAIARAWQEANVTHVLIHRAGLNFVLSDPPDTLDPAILARLEADFLEPVFDIAGAYQLYTMNSKAYKP
jgi:4-amino-4-deoxy-L-arabinose transferase-like glycosyltransferase